MFSNQDYLIVPLSTESKHLLVIDIYSTPLKVEGIKREQQYCLDVPSVGQTVVYSCVNKNNSTSLLIFFFRL